MRKYKKEAAETERGEAFKEAVSAASSRKTYGDQK